MNFSYRKDTFSLWKEDFEKTFQHLGVNDYDSLLLKCKLEVAEELKSDLEKGLQRFNGEMLGVSKINLQRFKVTELSSLQLSFYKTDFFTHQVLAKIHRKLKDKFNAQNIQDLNEFYTPFLSSLGITNFLIVDDGGKIIQNLVWCKK